MKNRLFLKRMAVVVTFLFIGVAVAPSINHSVVTASHDDDLVEVTTQACGIEGFKDTTVKLTREQYHPLEQYLVEFRARLNQTTTREEAVPIFKEAVMELDTYGLLPEGMSVEQALTLLKVSFFNKVSQIFSKRTDRFVQDSSKNALCLVTGQINMSVSVYPFLNILAYLGTILGFISFLPKLILFIFLMYREILFPNLIKMFVLIFELITIPVYLIQEIILYCMICSDAGPQSLRNIVGVGIYNTYEGGYQGSTGWLTSYGLFGKRAWNGTLYGVLPTVWIAVGWSLFEIYNFCLPGMMGFTGLKISSGEYNENKFYLGAASAVAISSEPPVLLQ
jgi:hypothetical protein